MGIEIIFPNSTNDGFHRVNGFKGIIMARTGWSINLYNPEKLNEKERERESSMNSSFIVEKLIFFDRIFLFLIT